MDTKYNGWTNYATWRVNLEVIDGLDPSEMWCDLTDVAELADTLEAYVEEVVMSDAKGLAADYARAFLSDVNWTEIAHHLADDYELFTDSEDAE